ncbi:PAS domain-containing protein [Aurantimonas aggregata]|uniref:Blue-light-activated histidine kinase n=1 Tax=Aurantimonas aggregata TaxID=2047720 RepID=A0A6L9MCN6_9HYPH|nr:PAS domain-containing protein [Aurantimonas aggregata]NDV85575.1 PAS domain-containing protein [Aurantimonas aggregata]
MSIPEFQRIFDVLPTPYMVVDRELRYVAVNLAYADVVLRSADELVGKPLFEMFPDDGESGRRLRASFAQVIADGEPDTIAFIPYDIPVPAERGGGVERRFWTATHTPILGADGQVEFVVQNTIDVTDIVRIKEAETLPFRSIPGELALLRHAQEVEEAYQEKVSESEEFRRLFRQAPGMIAVLEGPDHVFTFVNDSYLRFIGNRNLIGLPIRQVLPDIAGQGYFEMLDRVYATGQTVSGEGVRLMLQSGPDTEPIETFLDFSYNAIRDADGQISGVFVQATDRTESVRAAERQRLLIDELNHRVKNTLSTVQSMARQSFRNIRDPEEARYAFEARIMALSQAHNVLSARRWEAAGLSVLLTQELSVFSPDRVRIGGPEVHLSAKSAIALAMVFHELASNAARYGAMAGEDGKLSVTWTTSGRGARRMLDVVWQENTPTAEPRSFAPGFGMRILKRIIEGELSGSHALDLLDTGLICRFQVALSEVEDIESSAA